MVIGSTARWLYMSNEDLMEVIHTCSECYTVLPRMFTRLIISLMSCLIMQYMNHLYINPTQSKHTFIE